MKVFISLSACFLLSACGANFNSIFRTTDTSKGTRIVLQDAKQRAITISQSKPRTLENGEIYQSEVVCAEPSPDGLSALAAAASADANVFEKFTASAQGSSIETATNIGLRTPSVQALRDAMYRACEAYATGGLTEGEYTGLLRRYQNILMGLIAIEQVTGTITPQPVTIGGTSQILTGEALIKAQELLEVAEADVVSKTDQVEKSDEAITTLKGGIADLTVKLENEQDATKKGQIENEIKSKNDELTAKEGAHKDLVKARDDATANRDSQKIIRDAARKPNIGISSFVEYANVTTQTKSEASEAVAKVVDSIVGNVLTTVERSDVVTFCLASLDKLANQEVEQNQGVNQLKIGDLKAAISEQDKKIVRAETERRIVANRLNNALKTNPLGSTDILAQEEILFEIDGNHDLLFRELERLKKELAQAQSPNESIRLRNAAADQVVTFCREHINASGQSAVKDSPQPKPQSSASSS